jgi:hypothetical protein
MRLLGERCVSERSVKQMESLYLAATVKERLRGSMADDPAAVDEEDAQVAREDGQQGEASPPARRGG